MSDKDTQTRSKFEPPPWEREAFEALAAKRAEEQAVQDTLKAAAVAKPEEMVATTTDATSAPMVETIETAAAQASAPGTVAVDDKAVKAMLSQLQAEERTDGGAALWVGWVSAAVTFVLGAAVLVYGLLSLRSADKGLASVLGSAVLTIFGMSFMGMAVWVWIRTNRSRGRS
jgi:hypothetical protein